ncbi:hypothetical protein K2173_016755 [Erythroxylum novogranatense]|uniref:Uncharacterized protein n=1 Tax=Erythroxylum novogranatense TaxID=1862640 RepID=A0AAV8SHD4_9ROSI|nr:hypothetical protein K2173_016755 [Erythroxylum novogranatense]
MEQTCMPDSIIKDSRVPSRPAYVNLNNRHKYYASGELPRSTTGYGSGQGQPMVVDSVSCRQLYLRSYRFTRKESVGEKTVKCLGRVGTRVAIKSRGLVIARRQKSRNSSTEEEEMTSNGSNYKRERLRRAMELSALMSMLKRFMSCTTKIDVVG